MPRSHPTWVLRDSRTGTVLLVEFVAGVVVLTINAACTFVARSPDVQNQLLEAIKQANAHADDGADGQVEP